jgi:hypothetical protein
MPVAARAELLAHIDGLALRDSHERLRLRKPERERLVELLGGMKMLEDGRYAFLIAQAVDERYASVSPRTTGATAPVVEVPPVFLGETTNPPPRLGQMTVLAACRRWMRAFWFIGDALKLDVFGPLPSPVRRGLPSKTEHTLQGAVDDGELRMVLASWRRHAAVDLVRLPASPGCFAIGGLISEPPDDEVERILTAARERKAHVLLFPELSFSPVGFSRLQSVLASARARYPALTVAGRTHRPRPSGGFLNSAAILDATGRVLLEHEKMEPYSLGDGTMEDIVPRSSNVYEYFDTPVGRLVVNVCRDVRSDVPMLMNRLLGVSLLMVPAYSGTLNWVLEEARVLGARQQAIVAAANSPAEGAEHAVAFYVPIKGRASSISIPAVPAGHGTVHPFRISVGSGGMGKLDVDPPVTV